MNLVQKFFEEISGTRPPYDKHHKSDYAVEFVKGHLDVPDVLNLPVRTFFDFYDDDEDEASTQFPGLFYKESNTVPNPDASKRLEGNKSYRCFYTKIDGLIVITKVIRGQVTIGDIDVPEGRIFFNLDDLDVQNPSLHPSGIDDSQPFAKAIMYNKADVSETYISDYFIPNDSAVGENLILDVTNTGKALRLIVVFQTRKKTFLVDKSVKFDIVDNKRFFLLGVYNELTNASNRVSGILSAFPNFWVHPSSQGTDCIEKRGQTAFMFTTDGMLPASVGFSEDGMITGRQIYDNEAGKYWYDLVTNINLPVKGNTITHYILVTAI